MKIRADFHSEGNVWTGTLSVLVHKDMPVGTRACQCTQSLSVDTKACQWAPVRISRHEDVSLGIKGHTAQYISVVRLLILFQTPCVTKVKQ